MCDKFTYITTNLNYILYIIIVNKWLGNLFAISARCLSGYKSVAYWMIEAIDTVFKGLIIYGGFLGGSYNKV